jgi:hypothetical protein
LGHARLPVGGSQPEVKVVLVKLRNLCNDNVKDGLGDRLVLIIDLGKCRHDAWLSVAYPRAARSHSGGKRLGEENQVPN